MLSDKNTKNMVNIPRYVDDVYYRYTMPALKAKVEGRGNGIKTVIENMTPISQSLARPPAYMTKYFGFELGAQTICDEKNDRWIVNGKHEEEDLAKLLDDFIEKYILCKKCRNPETVMIVKKDSIELRCSACSAVTPVDTKHRLAAYIQKAPPSTKTQYDQHQSNQKEEDEGMGTIEDIDIDTNAIVKDEQDEDDWKADFSEEAVEKRRRELLGGSDSNILANDKPEQNGEKVDDGLEELAKYLNKRPLQEDIEILKKIKSVAEKNKWSKSKILQGVFGSLFSDSNIMNNIQEKAHILSLVSTDQKAQQYILFLYEKLCEKDKSAIEHATNLLNAFYDEEVIDEDIIMKWYKHPTKKIDAEVGKQIRKKATPFIQWLETASFSE